MNYITKRDNYSPLWGLNTLHRDIDSLFEGFLKPSSLGKAVDFSPTCDIEETSSHYQVTFDLAGVKKEDIHLEVRDNHLLVSGEKKVEKKSTEGKQHLSERFYGSFSRVFTLPSQVVADKVEATFKDGVLYISIPKTEQAKSQKITIS